MKDLLYKIALTKIPLVGAVTAKNLVSYCGGVREVFETKNRALQKIPGIGPQTAASILTRSALLEAEKELQFIEKERIEPIFYLDKDYPQRLRHFGDSPVMLYYKGTANLNHFRTVAIIGTRTPTPQGLSICEKLTEELAPFNPLIISGLAYGIDIAAHRKALDIGLDTLAVLGHGLSRIYPAPHKKTAFEIIGQGGLVTEFASHINPDRENFPMRNRIVAGLSDAVVVVETAKRGGSIITAQLANGYNKDVFAFPGRIKDKFSQGCHWLIKSNLANLTEGAADIAKTIGWETTSFDKGKKEAQQELFLSLSEDEKGVVDLIQQEEEIGIDQLSLRTKMTSSKLASILLNLEFKGIVRSLPGKRYILS